MEHQHPLMPAGTVCVVVGGSYCKNVVQPQTQMN